MEHYEFLYVLHRAHMLRKYIEDAEREGEVFHVSDHFSVLKNGLEAQAQIRKVNPSDAAPMMILRVRYRGGTLRGDEFARKTAHVFFAGTYTTLPTTIEGSGWIEHVYFSPDVLRPVTMPDEPAPVCGGSVPDPQKSSA